ncbi:MAG: hypothetical protein PHI66_04375 [Candidatus Pacebacteria bacterium]|nr:hypothetical protein [Candidatus Paceibacterota bacterium]
MKKKIIYIIRGVSGSGKTSLGENLVETAILAGKTASQFEADQFFTDSAGNYLFNRDELQKAHDDCFDRFCEAIGSEVEVVVLTNTSTKESEFQRYQEYAEKNGYIVFVSVVEHRHKKGDSHNISQEVKERQEENLRANLKLVL